MRALVVVVVALLGGVASAAPRSMLVPVQPHGGTGVVRDDGGPVRTIYLNPCTGGCSVTAIASTNSDNDDATTDTSILLQPPGTYSLDEFAFGSATWAAVVQCVQQVYSAYNVTVTDQRPASGVYNETLVAGLPVEGNLPSDTLGIAPIATDCSALSDEVAFVFANADPGPDHVTGVCWTVAQETAHIYGLDHEYEFIDAAAPTPLNASHDPSACSDPMTYQTDCGGQKFFRDYGARCGEFGPPLDNSPRDCRCSQYQNSHAKLMQVFGSGTPTWTAPTSQVIFPTAGSPVTADQAVGVAATAQRGIAYVELVLNGAVWTQTAGNFDNMGTPGSDYTLVFPDGVPDGVIDIVARAHDDLGGVADSAAVTVTKGVPCTSSATCAANQRCDATGRCVFPAASAGLGDACSYDQQCTSSLCQQGACTLNCDTLDPQGCPAEFHCASPSSGSTAGACLPGAPTGAGCCSAGGAGAPGAFALAGIVMLLARRRR